MIKSGVHSLKFIDLLTKEYSLLLEFLSLAELTDIQQDFFQKLKDAYLNNKSSIKKHLSFQTKLKIFPSSIPSSRLKQQKDLKLSRSQELLNNGFLDAISFKNFGKELCDSLISEGIVLSKKINNKSSHQFDYSFTANYLMPSISKLVEDNLEQIITSYSNLFGFTRDEPIYVSTELIIVEPGVGSRYNLHNDYKLPSEWMENPGKWTNTHLALTEVNENSSPLYLFPRTHSLVVSPSYILNEMLQCILDCSEKESELFLKALAITKKGGLEKKVLISNREFNATDTYSALIYKYYINNLADSWGKEESVYINCQPGQYTLFLPSLFHYSFKTNLSPQPRMSLVLRTCDKNTVYTSGIPYKNFLSFIEKVFENSAYTQKYSNEEIIEIILGGKPDKNELFTTAVLLNPNSNSTNKITFDGLRRLHESI